MRTDAIVIAERSIPWAVLAYGVVNLVAAALVSVLLPGDESVGTALLNIVAVLLMIGAGVVMTISSVGARTAGYAGGFVLALGALVLFALTIDIPATIPRTTDGFLLSSAKIAVVLFAGRIRVGPGQALALSTAMYVLSEVLVLAALAPDGHTWVFDLPVLVVWIFYSVVVFLLRRRAEAYGAASAATARADSADFAATERGRLRIRSSAVVHDTLLNELAVLATSKPGPLAPATAERIRSSLTRLAGDDWSTDAAGASDTFHPLEATIAKAADEGLVVTVTGEQAALAGLPSSVRHALLNAIDQCLVNVRRHSGVAEAEVAVMPGEDDITVMVVDDGSGFDTDEDLTDRLGLRNSIRGRIEDVGGGVQIFSQPGLGTSILLTVPRSTGTDR